MREVDIKAANGMCRLMINRGLSPRKVWIDRSAGYCLYVNTTNNPVAVPALTRRSPAGAKCSLTQLS